MRTCNIGKLIIGISKSDAAERDILNTFGSGITLDNNKRIGKRRFNIGNSHILSVSRIIVQNLVSLVKVEFARTVNESECIINSMSTACIEACTPSGSLGDSAVRLLEEHNERTAVNLDVTGANDIFVPCSAVYYFKIVEIGSYPRQIVDIVSNTVFSRTRIPCPVSLSCVDFVFAPSALGVDSDTSHICTAVIDIKITQFIVTVKGSDI